VYGSSPITAANNRGVDVMSWTKPEFEVVEVTMEVTAYVARR
jgi:coenzyme PQQ precursor peptide PqqA